MSQKDFFMGAHMSFEAKYKKKSNFINGTDTFPVWNIHALLLETAAFHNGTFFFKNKPDTRFFKLWPRVCYDTARQKRYTPLYHNYYINIWAKIKYLKSA